MATELEEFVLRELELKQSLPFGEWIRHTRTSHMQLLELVQKEMLAGPQDKTVTVDVFYTKRVEPDGPCLSYIDTFEIPANFDRVLVDMSGEVEVSGSRKTWRHEVEGIKAHLVRRGEGEVPMGTGK